MSKFSVTKAYTMAELIMSLFVMAVVAIGAINIVFKKIKTPKKPAIDAYNKWVCNATKLEKRFDSDAIYRNGYCDFDFSELPPELLSKEFFTITLIGGGGGGSAKVKGGNGEERVVYYPSLILPFRHEGANIKCESAVCDSCSSDGICTSCVKGYKMVSGTCQMNFKYRAFIGQGGGKNFNGGQTSLVVMQGSNVLGVLETAAGGITADASSADAITSSEDKAGIGGGKNRNGTAGEVRIEWN